MMREEALIMSKYPLDQEALVEEYGDLLIKIALKAYMKEQAQLLEQEEAEAAPVPAPKGNVVAAAFRQVNLEDAKETVLSGLKKGVTRVAVVLLAAAITFTTAFAASGTVRTGVFQHVINVIRKYSDLLANTSVMVEQPRYRYDELNVLEIPNEQVQEAFDVWVSFRDSISFWDSSSVYISDLVEALRYYCIEHDLDIPYADATRKWIKADALEQFAEWYFGVDADYLRRVSEVEAGSYDESKGYCNIYSRGTTLTPTAKAALTGYKDNADGTFEMEVTILAIAPMTGEAAEYCNPPMEVTVDMRSGHPVFLGNGKRFLAPIGLLWVRGTIFRASHFLGMFFRARYDKRKKNSKGGKSIEGTYRKQFIKTKRSVLNEKGSLLPHGFRSGVLLFRPGCCGFFRFPE